MRSIIAVLVGLAAATLLIGSWQVGLWWAWDPSPPTEGVAAIPPWVLMALLFGYLLGAALGGGVAARIAGAGAGGVCALAVGGTQTAVAMLTLSADVHPAWFMLLSPFAPLPASLLGARIALGHWPFSEAD